MYLTRPTLFLSSCLLFASSLLAQSGIVQTSTFSSAATSSPSVDRSIVILNKITSSRAIDSGIEVRSGRAIMNILALRDDVLRVRISPTGALGEDASWAVLDSSRHQRVHVIPDKGPSSVGFHTAKLNVKIDRSTMQLVIRNLEGQVLQADSLTNPTEFHGTAFHTIKEMPADEHYFGLGDKVGPLDRRNEAFTLWNTDAFGFQESTDPIYKSIPFFMAVRTGRAIGVLLDNTWRSSFDFGKASATDYSFGAEAGPLDYYVLYGPDPKQVVESYAWLTGPTPLPPLWSLGFQQSRYTYYPEARVREIADKLRADKIPADVIYLDIDYQKENRPFAVDEQRFPHFAEMIADLRKQHFHVVAITDLHIAYLPNAGYAPFDSGAAGDHFLKNPDGSTYIGRVWPGPSVFPDFTRKVTREWWGTLYKQFTSEGVAGFWNDMNEPAIFGIPGKTMPDSVQHRIDEPGFMRRTTNHREIHNVYGMQNSRATYEGLEALHPELRPFVLTRASYAGGQRYAATWTGDNSSTWNHLRLTTPMLLNLGLSGFALSGADVGGFAGSPQPNLLTKWLEVATFQPIDRDHTAKGTADQEPWVHGPEQELIRKKYIEERYRLMPYLYTTAEEMSRTGLPIVRPLFLEFPHAASDGHPVDIDAGNEFLFGPAMLVAPGPNPDELDPYEVLLPPANWYDYWTGEKIQRKQLSSKDAEQAKGPGGLSAVQPLVIHPTLASLPVYVREGTILPMQPLVQSTMEKPDGPLTLRVYPGEHCAGSLYQDDGETTSYQQGNFLRMNFTCDVTSNGLRLHISNHQGSYQPWWKTFSIEVYGWGSPSPVQISINGKTEQITTSYDSKRHILLLQVADTGTGDDIELTPSTSITNN
jgi:alpha-glucosidase